MYLLELESGELIDPMKIECIRIASGKKHLKLSCGEVFEITDGDLEHIKQQLNEDAEDRDIVKEQFKFYKDKADYIENFVRRLSKKLYI